MVASAPSKLNVVVVKLEYCPNDSLDILLVGLSVDSLLSVLFSFVVMISIILCMVTLNLLKGCLASFSNCIFTYFPKKAFNGVDTK